MQALRGWVLVVGLVGCTFDWEAYAPLGATTGAGGAPGGGGGGEGGEIGGGGGVGASGGGGAAGGGGAGGGVADPLVNRGLVVRYFIDEAGSGMGPTVLVDAAANPLGLGLTYSSGLSWGGVDPQRGLVWATADTPGDGRVAIVGTKIGALHGLPAATVEAVVNITEANGSNTHITCIGPGGNAGGLSLLLNGPNQVRLVWREGVNIGTWNVGITSLGRVVLHAVLDTAEPTSGDRTRLYVDGVLANTTGGTPPTPNELIDLSPDTHFVVGNGVGAVLSPGGTIHYVAMYGAGLTQQEVQTNAQRLLVSDDTSP